MKGTIRRILSAAISVIIMLSVCLPVTAATSKGFSYEVVPGSTSVKITGYNGIETDVVIPDIIDGRTVVEISSGAFASHSGIRSVKISSNVLRVMKDAFSNCTSLESVVIPASVSSIGDSAFAGCIALKDITISSASTAIGYYAFEGCTSLKEVTIPSTRIGYAAFRNCTALETIRLLDSVQTVGRYAFDATQWHKAQPKGLLVLGNVAYSYTGNDEDVVIPAGVRCIADYAFYGTSVKSVVIPDGLYYIGSYAFSECKNMTYISVPDSVISIGTKAIGYIDNAVAKDFIVYCYSDSTAAAWAKNNSLSTYIIDDCEHLFDDWQITVAPDCLGTGTEMHRCIKCNIAETQVVPAKGHAWSGWVAISELSCTTDGIKRRTCTVCAETEDDVVFTKGHDWNEWTVTVEPDCVNDGERNHTCNACGMVSVELYPATGHKWIVNDTTDSDGWFVAAEPTCDEIGTRSRICVVCSSTENTSIPAVGHKAEEWIVLKDPTAVEPGEKQGECIVCGETFTAEIPVVSTQLPDDVMMLTLATGAKITFNENRSCIYGIQPGTTVNEVLVQFEYSGHILVTDTQPKQLAGDDIIGSGCFLFLVRPNPETGSVEPVDTTCVIIKGDLNGDGNISASDAREALRASAKLTNLLSPYFLAGDLNGDNTITAGEARKILRVSSKLDTF